MTLRAKEFYLTVNNGSHRQPKAIWGLEVSGDQRPAIFNISGLGNHCWGNRAQFLLEKCAGDNRHCIAFANSNLHISEISYKNPRPTVTDFNFDRWINDGKIVYEKFLAGKQAILLANSVFGETAARIAVEDAQKIAAGEPKKIAGLILIAPMTNVSELVENHLALDPSDTIRKRYEAEGIIDCPIPPWDPGGKDRLLRLTGDEITKAEKVKMVLQQSKIRVECPVFLLHDPHDMIVKYESSEKLASRIKSPYGVELIPIPNIDHVLMPGVEPDYPAMWAQTQRMIKLVEKTARL
jgi:pimeloyl-ACP methyl ester carboxylesterase